MKAKYILIVCIMAIGCGKEPDPMQRSVFPATGSVTFRGKAIPDATVRPAPRFNT